MIIAFSGLLEEANFSVIEDISQLFHFAASLSPAAGVSQPAAGALA